MYWEQALGGSIEVAIAIAGFSGIVAVFGQRNDGYWRDADQLRLRVLLTASAVALLFSVLPFVALDSGVPARLFWRIGSGVQAAWLLSIAVYRLWQVKMSGVAAVMKLGVMIPMMIIVFLAQVANGIYYGLSWLYVIGVLFQLFVAFVTFAALLMDLWNEDEDAT